MVHDAEAPVYENAQAQPRAYLSASPSTAVSFARDDVDRVVLEAGVSGSAMLVLVDSYFPGWHAWVDGEPARIERTAEGFRSVAVAVGDHTIEMRYEPASYRVGLFTSLVALSLVLAAGAALFSFSRASAMARVGRSKATSRGTPSTAKR